MSRALPLPFAVAVLLFVQSPLHAQAVMDTFAGTGIKGFTGDGGLAKDATLNQPFHVEVDPRGFLYIAESDNHCIRKVDLKSGKIETVAGTGKKGYTGDGGPATAATMNEPYAIVVDDKGNLYIAERINAVVRKIDGATGTISTFAGTGTKGNTGDGGPAAKALLTEPNDVWLDQKGGLLIADVGAWVVRRVDLATGTISTFAGVGRTKDKKGGAASVGDGGPATKAVLMGARAVCGDAKGNIFICEREGSAIRKVTPDGIITTIGGTRKWGESGDGGDAKLADFKGPKAIRADKDGNLFIVDTENHSVRRIDAKTNIVTTVAGGRKGTGGDGGPATQAGMDRPHGCVVDAAGVLYIADSNNHRVRRVK